MSKFTSAMNAVRQRTSPAEPPAPDSQPKPELVAVLAASTEPAPATPSEPLRRGRPAGKRSSHATVQVTAYIDAQTHLNTKIQLLQNARTGAPRQDFSELVQHLLAEWLKTQQ